ncbi:MAG TPA: ABC transporter substrate-binding protein [Chloroflexota bacterium]|jgi:iron complex transport system substrate-binding protein|nr:ABC transporter substrate-binding protein [Chloroflexota bacterium]
MSRFKTLIAAVSLMALALTGVISTAAASRPNHSHGLFPVTIRDDTGTSVTIPRLPKRIISLDPRDTETLFALNLERRIVADGGQYDEGAFCCAKTFKYPGQWPSPWGLNYPARSHTLPHIEGGYDAAHPFDVEKVEAARPDLVLALNSDADGIQKMRSLGLKVVVLDPRTFAHIEYDIKLVGRITGNIHQASVVLANIGRRLIAVEIALARVRARPRVFYEIDDSTGTPYTACAGSFIDEMLSIAKATNVAHNVTPCPSSDPYPQMQTEALLAANPQYVLLGDSNYGVTPAQVKSRNGWQTIDAVKNNRIYGIDDDLISRAGPREIIGLEDVARRLHPKAMAATRRALNVDGQEAKVKDRWSRAEGRRSVGRSVRP